MINTNKRNIIIIQETQWVYKKKSNSKSTANANCSESIQNFSFFLSIDTEQKASRNQRHEKLDRKEEQLGGIPKTNLVAKQLFCKDLIEIQTRTTTRRKMKSTFFHNRKTF